jgi:PQQ-like domain
LILRLLLVFCSLAAAACAATSTAWEVNGFSDFLKGRLTNLSLSADGTLQLGPAVRWNTALDQPTIWSLAAASDGTVYAGTGHSGKVYRVSANGTASLVWSAGQSEIFALAVDAKGILYAGTSPSGGVYRIENGQAVEVWHSPSKYIWAIQFAPDGALLIATGEQGRIYRLPRGAATAEVFYETGQANVTALTVANGHVYAGTDPNGIIYDISSPGQATILYDSTLPEIRTLAVDGKGFVYAAAMGGAVSSRSIAPGSVASSTTAPVIATTPTVITVTDAKENGTSTDNDQSGLKVATDPARSNAAAAASAGSAVVEVAGVEKSAIYRISPDHTIETLRSSKSDNVYDLLLDADGLIFSTDDRGRIYRYDSGRTTLLSEPGDGETTRLLQSSGNLFAALSNPGRLLSFGPAGSAPGKYESPVHDSVSVARWGHLQWHGAGTHIVFSTRSGNAARPDNTWSKWSEPAQGSNGSLIASPAARFIQWRAEWVAGSDAQVGTVDIPYLPQNAPPVVHSITVASIIGSNPAKSGPAAASNASSAYSITVTDTGEAPAASAATSASQSVSRLQSTQTQISWQADDPDSDKLVYSVYFRSEDGVAWQLIRSRMFENTLLLDPDVFADGRYYFKIVASDAPSNSSQFARQSELISSPVLIDNTPPLVTVGAPQRSGASVDLDIDAADATSPLRMCEYSMDAGFWQPIESTDGVTDSPRERFHLRLDNLRPGEHLLVFRVYDAANNAGLARVLLK